MELLSDDNYIKGVTVKVSSIGFVYGTEMPRLTTSGHELCNGLKNLDNVSFIKKKAKELGQNLTLEFINACISSLVSKLII